MATPADRYAKIGVAMDIDMRGTSTLERAKQIIGELTAMRVRVGVVDSVATRGVRSADLAELAGHEVDDACLVTNPRRANKSDLQAIYGDAL